MHRPTHHLTPTALAAIGVLMLGSLAGCTGNAGATPTTTEPPLPTTAPSASPGAEQADQAIAAYEAYEQMIADTAADGGYDIVADGEEARPESVLATTMGEEREYVDGSNQRLKLEGKKEIERPADQILRLEVVESKPLPDVPGGHRVILSACVDNRRVFDTPDGEWSPPDKFFETRPTLYYDTDAPAGWKVADMQSEGVDEC